MAIWIEKIIETLEAELSVVSFTFRVGAEGGSEREEDGEEEEEERDGSSHCWV